MCFTPAFWVFGPNHSPLVYEKIPGVRSRCNFWRVRAKNRMSHADWSSWHCFVVRETVPRQSTAVDRTRTCGLNASCCRHRQLPRECSQRSAYRRYTSTARCNDGRYDSTWRALVIQQWRDGSARLYHQSPLGIITTSLHVTVKVHHHRIAARPKSLPSAHQGTDAPAHRPTDPPTHRRTHAPHTDTNWFECMVHKLIAEPEWPPAAT